MTGEIWLWKMRLAVEHWNAPQQFFEESKWHEASHYPIPDCCGERLESQAWMGI